MPKNSALPRRVRSHNVKNLAKKKRNSSIGSFWTGQRMPDMASRRAFTAKMSDCCRAIVPICIVRIAHYARYRCLIVAFDAKRSLSIFSRSPLSHYFFFFVPFVICSRACVIYCWSNGRSQPVKTNRLFPIRLAVLFMRIALNCTHCWIFCTPYVSLFVRLFFFSTTELLAIRATAEKRICAENTKSANTKVQLWRSFSRSLCEKSQIWKRHTARNSEHRQWKKNLSK